jgi:hypothetical protein
MFSSLSTVSIIDNFSITSLQLMSEQVIVCEAPQSITTTDFSFMTWIVWSDGHSCYFSLGSE